jgi:hypothetical protein
MNRKPSGMMKNTRSQTEGGTPRVQNTRGFCFQLSTMALLLSVPTVRLAQPAP